MLLIIWEIGVIISFMLLLSFHELIETELKYSDYEMYEYYKSMSSFALFMTYILISLLWPIDILLGILSIFNR